MRVRILILLAVVTVPELRLLHAQGPLDGHGDPLPPQAVARLGAMRLRLRVFPSSITFSPDSKLLVTTEYEIGRVQFWDVKTGRLVREWSPGTASCVGYSPDGKYLVTGNSYGPMHLWNAATGRKIRKLYDSGGHSFAFAPNGKHVVTTLAKQPGNGQQWASAVMLFDLESGVELRRFPGFDTQPQVYLRLAWSPDGKYIAGSDFSGGSGGHAKVIVWDAATGRPLCVFREAWNVYQMIFTPDSKHLIIGGDERVRVVDIATGKLIRQLSGEARLGVALDPTGKLLLSACAPLVWDLASGKLARRLEHTALQHGWHAAWSPDGRYAAVSMLHHHPFLTLWDMTTGKEVRFDSGHRLPVDGISISPDGNLIATASARERRMCLWEGRGGTFRRDISIQTDYALVLDSFRFSSDSKSLTLAGTEWDVTMGKMLKPVRKQKLAADDQARLFRSFLSPDNTLRGWMSSDEESVHVWDAVDEKRLPTIAVPDRKTQVVCATAFSPDGKVLATAFQQNRGAPAPESPGFHRSVECPHRRATVQLPRQQSAGPPPALFRGRRAPRGVSASG